MACLGEGEVRKGSLVNKFHLQSNSGPKMDWEDLEYPIVSIEVGERGPPHLFNRQKRVLPHVAESRRTVFITVQVWGKVYRCVAMPFGWGSSGMWCVKLMRLLARNPGKVCITRTPVHGRFYGGGLPVGAGSDKVGLGDRP